MYFHSPWLSQIRHVLIPAVMLQKTTYLANPMRRIAHAAALIRSALKTLTASTRTAAYFDPVVLIAVGKVQLARISAEMVINPLFRGEGGLRKRAFSSRLLFFFFLWNSANRWWLTVYSIANMGLSLATVNTSSGVLFCCGLGYNATTGNCLSRTRQMGYKPFNLPSSFVVFNRSTGSTILPAAVPAQSLRDVTANVLKPIKHDITVTLGVGLPLPMAVLAALRMFYRERDDHAWNSQTAPQQVRGRNTLPRCWWAWGLIKYMNLMVGPLFRSWPLRILRN